MYQQYYYYAIYLLRTVGELFEAYWWRYVDIVHVYPVTAISVLLSGILFLMIMSIKRHGTVTVIVGEELHDLIRAMRGEE